MVQLLYKNSSKSLATTFLTRCDLQRTEKESVALFGRYARGRASLRIILSKTYFAEGGCLKKVRKKATAVSVVHLDAPFGAYVGERKKGRPSGGLRNTVLGSDRRKRNVFKAYGVISVTPFALPSVHGSG